jgi:hypothetical protein
MASATPTSHDSDPAYAVSRLATWNFKIIEVDAGQ